MKKLKKVTPLVLSAAFIFTQTAAPVLALENTTREIRATFKTLLTGTQVSELKWNGSDWAQGLDFPNIDKYSDNSNDSKYANSIDEILVNGTKYKKDINEENSKLIFEISPYGLRIKDGAFVEGDNTILIKAKGYKNKEIHFSKNGKTYKLVSQKDIGDTSDGVQILNKDSLNQKIDNAKLIKQGTKTYKAFKTLQIAIQEAEKVRDTAKTQSELNNAVEALQNAINTFENTQLDPEKLENGEYTLSFRANVEGKDSSSMLQGAFDPKVKLTVKNGEMKISMLNTGLAKFLLDFSIESNGQYPKSEQKKIGEPDNDGTFKLQEFTIPIKNLSKMHKGAVLVTMMGGQITDIGKYEKYTKLDMTFGSNIEKGWTGYKYDIDNKNTPTDSALLEQVLVKKGFDLDGDKKISKAELQAISGELDLSSYKLTDISMLKDLSDKVTTLDISRNNIKVLPKGLLDNMTNLENFYAQANHITDIPENFFLNNNKISYVALSTNKLTAIDNKDFTGLSSVVEIDLGENSIESIDKNAFDGLNNLTSLSFSGNKLKEIPSSALKSLSSLKMIFLDNNFLSKIPDGIESLTKLEKIYLTRNRISEINSESFKNLQKLKHLVLNSNRISKIEKAAFVNNTQLEELRLYDNDLTSFNTDILPDNIKLRTLDLQMNNINKVDSFLRKLVGDAKIFPQKSVTALSLNVDKNQKLKWSQEFGMLDLLLWYNSTVSNMDKEITSIKEYKNMLASQGLENTDIVTIMNDKGYDWDIKTELQRKNDDGIFTTVSENISSDKADELSGSFKVNENGTYRIVKSIYPSTYGDKQYKYSIVSNEITVNQIQKPETPGTNPSETPTDGNINSSLASPESTNTKSEVSTKPVIGQYTNEVVTTPKTGDFTNIGVWASILTASAGMLAFIIRKKSRKEIQE
ncbi:MAG: leucine-rich repeat protein [Clostridium cadaveris]|uniref:leucine-rich repeat protein n=1 Tax=Clostridium cadaveris TaxID=1529 RepID=UPI002A8D4532|nr:leucine-rich repeat protein [Clostridium cadaveris]